MFKIIPCSRTLIRTEPSPKHRIESEYRTHSDRTKPETQNRVRIPHSFGQNQAQNTKTSPNSALIRTEPSPKHRIESEYRTHSDRTKPETQKRVRIQHSFGQNQAQNTESSPNTALIRTEPSPKHRIESEHRTHSDRTKPETQNRVRIPHSFGQNQAQNTESSPNTALIRTEPSPKYKNESEYRTHSDRTKPKTQNRVRI
jgi:hypothetical protein